MTNLNNLLQPPAGNKFMKLMFLGVLVAAIIQNNNNITNAFCTKQQQQHHHYHHGIGHRSNNYINHKDNNSCMKMNNFYRYIISQQLQQQQQQNYGRSHGCYVAQITRIEHPSTSLAQYFPPRLLYVSSSNNNYPHYDRESNDEMISTTNSSSSSSSSSNNNNKNNYQRPPHAQKDQPNETMDIWYNKERSLGRKNNNNNNDNNNNNKNDVNALEIRLDATLSACFVCCRFVVFDSLSHSMKTIPLFELHDIIQILQTLSSAILLILNWTLWGIYVTGIFQNNSANNNTNNHDDDSFQTMMISVINTAMVVGPTWVIMEWYLGFAPSSSLFTIDHQLMVDDILFPTLGLGVVMLLGRCLTLFGWK